MSLQVESVRDSTNARKAYSAVAAGSPLWSLRSTPIFYTRKERWRKPKERDAPRKADETQRGTGRG